VKGFLFAYHARGDADAAKGQHDLAIADYDELKGLSNLQACAAQGGRDTYTMKQKWVRARALLEDARASGLRVPLLFGDATDLYYLVGWALLDDVTVGEETTFTFSGLTLLPAAVPKSVLLKENGEPLPDTFRRAYAICKTPAFVRRQFAAQGKPVAPKAGGAARDT
jgi:hypothetical protein